MKTDYHIHTEFSDDSETPMEAQIARALELGLDEICFTEHVDYGVKKDWDEPGEIEWLDGLPKVNADYPKYFAKIDAMEREYGDRIRLKRGLEFGAQTHTAARFDALFEKYRDQLDFTLLSIHQVGDEEYWNQKRQRGRSQEEYNFDYWREMLGVVERFKNYSVLAHLDLVARYDHAGHFPFARVRDLVVAILERAIADGKGIEINTSSWRYKLEDTTPSREILALYRDLGGKIITLGSDAHRPEWLGSHMDDARAILRDEFGFAEFCTFEKMTPVFHPL